MAEGPPPPVRKPKKVPRYDEYGNYLGDVREDELKAIEEAAAKPLPPPVPAAAPRPPPSAAARPSGARPAPMAAPGPIRRPPPRHSGPLYHCGLDTTLFSQPSRCSFMATSELELMLHRADRHLVYPPGGIDELRRRDPMRVAEERERLARQRKGGTRAADGPSDSTILGLNIKLDTPELIEEWIKQRKKRFPTAALIEQKQARSRLREQPRQGSSARAPSQAASSTAPSATQSSPSHSVSSSDSDSSTDSSSDSSESDADSSSDSDMDPVRDAVSSKLDPDSPHGARPTPALLPAKRAPADGAARPKRRTVPRRAAPNPFEVPDLLRQLLEREILQHVDALAQWLDFVLDNDFLSCVERHQGEAAAQRARRAKVTDLSEQAASEAVSEVPPRSLAPIASPPLRALDELEWPDEPDPLIYLDPLRAADPKPLRLSELETLAMDPTLRAILQPTSALHPRGEDNRALRRALETWRALPTPRHREAALQLILGVGADSPVHAHEAYAPAYQRVRGVPRSTNMQQGRVIGETELFRLGLRA
ncbi:hypothetical protein MCAP1_002896 [Malassezia caprae]|uniref:FMR1-interacting protein 1 conserved domain-containing protein n=1 Tax=Malassezia caprae TaxID=1381934 RepID=A0AAF0IX61_9BASI|nr:hypothetical protein MCAP1_002896 [Malassezia caprae]